MGRFAFVTAFLFVGVSVMLVAAAQPPKREPTAAPTVTAPAAASTAPTPTGTTPAPLSNGQTVFQKTEDPKAATKTGNDKPAVVKPDGTSADNGEKPTPVKVKETQPVGGTTAPPDNNPELSAPVPPAETLGIAPPVRYFALIFGSQSSPKRARYTHTWYTIVKATPKNDLAVAYDPQGHQLQYYDMLAHTISWLPRSLNIRVLKLRPDCGVNLSLHPTINYCRSQGECIALWGPYEVNPLVAEELYDKSVKQIARLNSGRVLYKAIDPDHGPKALYIFDCIHAVSDLDGPGRRSQYDEMQRYGFDASAHLANVMARANRIDVSVTHEWVVEALDLSKYCLQRRTVAPAACKPSVVATAE